MFAQAMFLIFPALFLPSQVYTVVSGTLVKTKKNGEDCRGINTLFLYHHIVGIGSPSATQYNNNLLPTLTMYGDSAGSIVTLGASTIYTYKILLLVNIH